MSFDNRPIRNRPFISFAIPSSIVSEAPDLREKTRKLGYVSRAAAIFRIEEILIYRDDTVENEELVYNILTYQEVPPYLKKRLIPYSPLLRYAGILPPLKTPHHVYPNVFDTVFREGVVDRITGRGSIIDIGLDKPGLVLYKKLAIGSRVTVKIVDEVNSYYIVDLISRDEVDIYWGYRVSRFSSMSNMLSYAIERYDLIIGATKKGELIYRIENELTKSLLKSINILIIFGGPRDDIDEIAKKENIDLSHYCSYFINFVPRQGVESIRTEEAIFAVLSILNYLKEKTLSRNR